MPSDASTLPAPAPCTPEEFDIFWEKVEELELQDVLQCIGDDLSGAEPGPRPHRAFGCGALLTSQGHRQLPC